MNDVASSFETDIAPIVKRIAGRRGLSGDDTGDALTLAWYAWRMGSKPVSPVCYAIWAVRRVRAGRPLPGTGTRARDVFRALARRDGGDMEGHADRAPGPDDQVAWTEALAGLFASLTPRERRLVEMILEGMPGKRIAAVLGISPGRVTQLRQEVAKRCL